MLRLNRFERYVNPVFIISMSPNFDRDVFTNEAEYVFTMTFAYLLSFKFSNLREGWEAGTRRVNGTLKKIIDPCGWNMWGIMFV